MSNENGRDTFPVPDYPEENFQRGALRVLIVEDDDNDATLLIRELHRAGFEVTHQRVDTESDMRQALISYDWDIITCDSKMPEFSADMALRVFKELNREDIPFIIVSGKIGEENAANLIRSGADEYVPKDKMGVVGAAIEHAIESASQRVARRRADEEVSILLNVSRAINEAENITEALENTLREVCSRYHWPYAEAWMRSPSGNLDAEAFWHDPDDDRLRRFREYSSSFSMPPGKGLIGRVWVERQPIWIPDIAAQDENVFLRAPMVRELGLAGATFAIPILVNNVSLAVLSFLLHKPSMRDRRSIEILRSIASQIASIIQQKEFASALEESEARFQTIVSNISGIIKQRRRSPDGKHTFTYISPSVMDILGFPPEYFSQDTRSFEALMHEDDRVELHRLLKSSAESMKPWDMEYRIQRSDGSERWLHTRGVPRSLDDGSIVWDDIGLDITERKKAQQQLEYNARFDQLTGLPNRQSLIQRLRKKIRSMQSDNGSIIILAIGLERLEHIIQTLGHDMGDAIIFKAASVLEETLSRKGLMGRAGGTLLICEPVRNGQESLTRVIDRIHALFSKELILEHTSMPIQIRIGATTYPDDKTTSENLIRHAEIALSQNRVNHSLKYQIYSDEIKDKFLKRHEIEQSLRKAIVSNQLICYFQPIIDIHSNRPIGCETLSRWKTGEGNFIPPDEFIPVAEETGLIIELGNRVIENACKQYRTWQDMGLELQYISVNVAAKQLQNAEFVEYVENILIKYNLPAASLKIELTESGIMDDPQAAIATMLKLSHLNIGLAIDDFGTGLSSLSYLQKFPIELLKIDKSFISDIDKDRGQAAIVQAITAMAKTLGQRTIAEGVETEEHKLFVKAYGVDYVQGYLVSRPLPANDFVDFIKNYRVG